MTQKKKTQLKNWMLGLLAGVLIAVVGGSVVAQSTGFGTFLSVDDMEFLLKLVLDKAQGNEPAFGGTTAGDWNVGGALTVTGATTLTGAQTFTGATTISGNSSVGGTFTVTGESNLARTIDGGSRATVGWNNVTTSAANWCDNRIVRWRGSATTTLGMASSSALIADCLPAIGDSIHVLFHNFSTSNEAAIRIKTTDTAADNTMVMLVASSTDDTSRIQVEDKSFALIQITNLTGSTTTVSATELRNAD